VTGWVLAAGILLAARLGRSASEASRFDLPGLQVIHLPILLSVDFFFGVWGFFGIMQFTSHAPCTRHQTW
jgi:hypothetical protein